MVLGVRLALPDKQDEKDPYILLRYYEQKYLVQMGDTPAGNARRVINTLKSFQKITDKDKEQLDKMVARKAELQKMVQSPDNTYTERLANCEKEAEELRELITMREDCA